MATPFSIASLIKGAPLSPCMRSEIAHYRRIAIHVTDQQTSDGIVGPIKQMTADKPQSAANPKKSKATSVGGNASWTDMLRRAYMFGQLPR